MRLVGTGSTEGLIYNTSALINQTPNVERIWDFQDSFILGTEVKLLGLKWDIFYMVTCNNPGTTAKVTGEVWLGKILSRIFLEVANT